MDKNFQILALDGGGIKGLFSAAVLAHWEDQFDIRISDHFDLILGASTGGIIAIGLGLGLRPKDIVKFYVEKGNSIFGKKRNNLFTCKYERKPLEDALRDPNCFGDRLLGESKKRLVIPTYNLGDDGIYLFKTAHHERLRTDYKVPAYKVALATSAAPSYFPSYQGVDHIRHIDGGVWANNPAMIGIVEALTLLNVSLEQIRILSLGTTDQIVNRPKDLDRGGMWQWRKHGIDVALRGQSIGTNAQVSLLLGKQNVLRLDPKVPDKLFALDKLSEKELLSKAANTSRGAAPEVKSKFLNYKAEVFNPIHCI